MSATETLAAYVVNDDGTTIPADVWREASRAVLNYLGCAIGGSIEPALDIAIDTFTPFSGETTASVLGRRERFDPLHAALLNGIGSHVHEFDDTTPKNYIHPSIPVASALFAHASANAVSGRNFIHAFILGFEAESRIGNAVYPAHYDAGWHITSTAGVFGAAAAIGKLLGLSKRQMIWAFGLAATQSAGIREMFGSMAKSFQPGRAAQNGYTAALLARADFTAGEHALEGPRGFAAVTAVEYDLSKVSAGLGVDFDLRANAYKPYACGLVVHPAIDGCSQLHRTYQPDPETIVAVRLRVAPLVLDLCNQRELRRALQSKYSIYHAAAIGLVRGKGGLQEFTDEAIADPRLARIRQCTTAVADQSVGEDQVGIEVELAGGEVLSLFVEQSLGNVHRPLSDEQLEEKFRDQAVLALPSLQVDALIEQCWRLDSLQDAGALARTSVPGAGSNASPAAMR
ncbi:MmgE/PrpD family protein [Candidatus Rariloculus sp.]|uniref:MmgE/PrpD family protein n=1 Tax=Candidatus Rariloculus sp. TaxID=3101265 RepID=UPI003D1099BD